MAGLPPDHRRSPRIVHLIPTDGVGGVETAARSTAEADTLDCDLNLVFLAGRSVAQDRRRIIDHPGRSLNNPATFIGGIRTVLGLDPDILVCSLWRSMIVGLAVKVLRPRISLVAFLHCAEGTHFADRLVQWLMLRFADEIWADSATTLEARAGDKASQGRVISFVIDRLPTAAAPDWQGQGASFVSWGRLHRHKGHDRAIALIRLLADRDVDATLSIWGPDDGEGPALAATARQLGVADRVRFEGPLDRRALAKTAANHGLFLQLSRTEGMAMSVVEAMQLGLVPVVTPAGEIPRYVRDGDNGIIVDPDDLEAAAARIARLVGKPAELSRMRLSAIAQWRDAETYAVTFCRAAHALWAGK